MNSLFLSVIVPVYNSTGKIDKLLTSLDEQTYRKFEIIFVDDGSTDGSYECLKKYAADRNNVKVLKQKNAGPGVARKRGFESCKGSIVYFIDSDDWLAGPDTLVEINRIFSEDKNIDACLARRKVYPSGDVLGPFDGSDLDFGVYDLNIFYNHMIHGNMSMKVFRREVLSSADFVGSFNYEDLTASYLALDKCRTIKYVDSYFYFSNHAKDKKSLTTDVNYLINTLPEKARNLIIAMNIAKTPQIKTALASAMLGAYYCFIVHGMQKENQSLINELRKGILQYDLSGFRHAYSLKKRVLLFLMRARKK